MLLRSALYQRIPKLFSELALARGDGRYARLLETLARVELLILDDWGLEPLNADRAPRSARNPRRALWPPLDRRDQPASCPAMARGDRRSDPCGRHPRSPRSQRTPRRDLRRKPSQDQSASRKEGLTETRNQLQLCSPARRRKWAGISRNGARIKIGTVGALKSE